MFNWFKKRSSDQAPAADAEDQVKVFLNPLLMLLAGRERQKGSPLTREEVLEVRDTAQFVMLPRSQADAFYASLDAKVPVYRIDPDRCWEEWQELRDQIEW